MGFIIIYVCFICIEPVLNKYSMPCMDLDEYGKGVLIGQRRITYTVCRRENILRSGVVSDYLRSKMVTSSIDYISKGCFRDL